MACNGADGVTELLPSYIVHTIDTSIVIAVKTTLHSAKNDKYQTDHVLFFQRLGMGVEQLDIVCRISVQMDLQGEK